MPTLDDICKAIAAVASRYPVSRASVFGSYARGEQRPGSDVDVLLDKAEGYSLFSQCGITNELQDILGVSVDVVTRASLKPEILTRAEKDEVVAYVAA